MPCRGCPSRCGRRWRRRSARRPIACTVSALARRAQITRRTCERSFARAGLPSPKIVMLLARVLYAHRLLLDPGYTIEDVALKLGYATPADACRPISATCSDSPPETSDVGLARGSARAGGAAVRRARAGGGLMTPIGCSSWRTSPRSGARWSARSSRSATRRVSSGDPSSAYVLLSETKFDALVLDLRLPHTLGDAFYFAVVRQWPELRGRVILMSRRSAGPAPRSWPQELRDCPMLAKPFTLDLLARTLDAVVEPRRAPPDQRAMTAPPLRRPRVDPLVTLREYRGLAPWGLRDLTALAAGILDASGVVPVSAVARARPTERTIRFYVAAPSRQRRPTDAGPRPPTATATCSRCSR